MAIRSVLHPTDFSESSLNAFVHALRIALSAKSQLDIVHVMSGHEEDSEAVPPRVRRTLAMWGLMAENDPPSAVARLGISVRKADLASGDPITRLLSFLRMHQTDLLVLGTQGREGLIRWLHGSVAEALVRRARSPALFVRNDLPGFVSHTLGLCTLKRVLLPVDHDPSPGPALRMIGDFLDLFGKGNVELRLLHVGTSTPIIAPHDAIEGMGQIMLHSGHPVEVILKEASEWSADLIAMPTAGHVNLGDALSGSTTEQVLRRASCPVLAVPDSQLGCDA